jgi:hypothetical protein
LERQENSWEIHKTCGGLENTEKLKGNTGEIQGKYRGNIRNLTDISPVLFLISFILSLKMIVNFLVWKVRIF